MLLVDSKHLPKSWTELGQKPDVSEGEVLVHSQRPLVGALFNHHPKVEDRWENRCYLAPSS